MRFPNALRLGTFCLLAALAPACAAPDDGEDSSAAAISGAPGASAAVTARDDKAAYLKALDRAYDEAKPEDFTVVPATALSGPAHLDWSQTMFECREGDGFRVGVHRWAAKVPTSPDDLTLQPRRLFVLSSLHIASAWTINLAVYDEQGKFVFGRRYSRSFANLYTPDVGELFRSTLSTCKR